MSKIKWYFDYINTSVKSIYNIAEKAKLKGYDPNNFVEIPLAKQITKRVEALISILSPQVLNSGISERIGELEKKYPSLSLEIALIISYEVASEKFCNFSTKKEAIETGIRIGFAYITLGVISAPLEGLINIEFKNRLDDKQYISLNYSGPIRSAGGTAGALSVIIADYLRIKFGYDKYDPIEEELNRFYTEIYDFHNKVTRLQYFPTKEEISMIIKNIGVEISGHSTENLEVSGFKNLQRITTNKLRGGVCLVVAECLCQKAEKLYKNKDLFNEKYGLKDWLFLKDFIDLQKKIKSKNSIKDEVKDEKKILPNFKYIEDVMGGRPVLGFPSTKGAFRLRYGRNRVSGFASTSIGNYSFEILNNFIAVGTQLKIERPGKSTIVTPSDCLEPPIVKLNDGSVLKLDSNEKVEKYKDQIEEIIHIGDILISYGEFRENNHRLMPNGYVEEEWAVELVNKINNDKK